MLQIVLSQPGHFTATEGPEPTLAPGEALVRVHRIGICGTDLHAFAGKQPFFNYPRILGHELGVEVIDPGSDPHGLKAGDRLVTDNLQKVRPGAPVVPRPAAVAPSAK